MTTSKSKKDGCFLKAFFLITVEILDFQTEDFDTLCLIIVNVWMICRHFPHRGFKVGTLRSQAPPMAAIYKNSCVLQHYYIYNLAIGVRIQLSKFTLKLSNKGSFKMFLICRRQRCHQSRGKEENIEYHHQRLFN